MVQFKRLEKTQTGDMPEDIFRTVDDVVPERERMALLFESERRPRPLI